MKKLELTQMENLQGGLTSRHWGCGLAGLAAGIVAGPLGPIVGGMVTASCFLLN
ncbi:hypothetical protein [Flavobacterium piscis]|uniref:Class IIb bacteriocin, lactobin A/cerein 7B family n=1 Tax=Flavobacterium piscis TaxID=1114874 RepID=A0ABU1Y6B6_9FLAO|nr:hypothetical protein [Flavobacterium piscis]MDR7209772.1 hypothetical protein [Flavobacterium piscis]